jgi:hypothetical protein
MASAVSGTGPNAMHLRYVIVPSNGFIWRALMGMHAAAAVYVAYTAVLTETGRVGHDVYRKSKERKAGSEIQK